MIRTPGSRSEKRVNRQTIEEDRGKEKDGPTLAVELPPAVAAIDTAATGLRIFLKRFRRSPSFRIRSESCYTTLYSSN